MADLTPANDVETPIKVPGARRRMIRKWLHRVTLGVAILAPLTFIVAAVGYKLGVFDLGMSLMTMTFKIGPLLLALSMLLALLTMISAWLVKPNKGFVIAAVAAIIPALGGAKIAKVRATAADLPYIHDVTTDTQNPPEFGKVVMDERAAVEGVNTADYIGKKAPAKNAEGAAVQKLVSALQTKAYPEIRPLVLSEDRDVVFGEALATVKAMGWKIKREDLASGRIDATDTTFWYGFEDDVTIRLRDSEGGGTIVDVRSLSRVGGSDLGKNAARVGEFLDRLGS